MLTLISSILQKGRDHFLENIFLLIGINCILHICDISGNLGWVSFKEIFDYRKLVTNSDRNTSSSVQFFTHELFINCHIMIIHGNIICNINKLSILQLRSLCNLKPSALWVIDLWNLSLRLRKLLIHRLWRILIWVTLMIIWEVKVICISIWLVPIYRAVWHACVILMKHLWCV